MIISSCTSAKPFSCRRLVYAAVVSTMLNAAESDRLLSILAGNWNTFDELLAAFTSAFESSDRFRVLPLFRFGSNPACIPFPLVFTMFPFTVPGRYQPVPLSGRCVLHPSAPARERTVSAVSTSGWISG